MEEKKKVNFLTIILAVLLVIAVGIIGYLIGSMTAKDNNLNNNEIKEENKQETEVNNEITPVAYTPKCDAMSTQEKNLITDVDVSKYDNIFEYIKNQENVKITIDYCKIDENDPQADANGMVKGVYELTNAERENVFKEMKNSSTEIAKSGIGGVCVQSLEISYERNNKQYFVSFWGFFAMNSNDGNIYKIIDKSVNNTLENPEACLYATNNLSSTASSIVDRLTND